MARKDGRDFGTEPLCKVHQFCLEADHVLNINHLPDEMIRYIMSFFNQHELCKTIAPVCKLWCQFAYDPVRWQSLELPFTVISSPKYHGLFARLQMLKSLTISLSRSTENVNAESVASIFNNVPSNCCRTLTEIRLSFVTVADFQVIDAIVTKFPLLQSLSIAGSENINMKCIQRICDMAHLTAIDISHCPGITNEKINILSKGLVNLCALNVDGLNHLTDDAIINLINSRGSQLQQLTLDGEGLTDASFENIGRCCVLQSLKVSFAVELTDKSLGCIQQLKQLQVLCLRKSKEFTPKGLCLVFANDDLSGLRHVDFSECQQLNDDVLVAMCRCAGPNITYLALNWCWVVSDVGLSCIVEHCSKLRHLYLIGIHLITGQCLEKVPVLLPHLSFLDLRQCPKQSNKSSLKCVLVKGGEQNSNQKTVIDTVLQELVLCKPNLTAIDYYGEGFSDGGFSDGIFYSCD